MTSSVRVKSPWKKLKSQILTSANSNGLNSYDIVNVAIDESGNPQTFNSGDDEVSSFLVFTSEHLERRVTREYNENEIAEGLFAAGNLKSKKIMLGTLCDDLRKLDSNSYIKVNPILTGNGYMAENVLFCPAYDKVTQKSLLTDPDDAKALLAIDPEDQKRLGIEMTFFMLTSRSVPDHIEDRQNYLKEKIEELAFVAPRVPMKRGSGSFLVVILNLDNELEEQAFIREYKMFDDYCDVVFVTSSLRLLSGSLDEIHYNGEEIDTVFLPMINWQKSL